jgi:uncharacterized membrane protein HdeD (DUF308 family)
MELSIDFRSWWVFALRGLVAIAFGIMCWIVPGMALLTLVFLFGAYAIVDGISAIASALNSKERPRWPVVFYAAVSVVAGLIAFLSPGITALALLFLIAARALVTGALELVAAVQLRKEVEGEWLLALSGILSIAFAILLFVFPGPGALGLILWIGSFAVIFGGILIALGFRLRTLSGAAPPRLAARRG